MPRSTYFSFVFLFFLAACSGPSREHQAEEDSAPTTIQRDISEVLEEGQIRALTDFSSSSYFIYKGIPMGFEYELLERFATYLGVDLKIVLVDDMDEIIEELDQGKGDLIAANFTVTNDRKKRTSFSNTILQTKQVLVQKLPEDAWKMKRSELDKALVKNPLDLLGKKVHVREGSSFYPRLVSLMNELGGVIDIEKVHGIGTEKLIEMVSEGEIEFTVADENVAILNKAYFPNIDVNTELSFDQNVAWACRKTSPQLLDTLNAWLESFKKTEEFAVLHLKYFKARTQHKQRVLSEYSSLRGDKISPYDEMIKVEAERLGWDWKLLAAMIYQESKFVADAEAWTGASGLMQLVPETAERFGADSLADPAQNIHAGVSFLISLQNYWKSRLADSTQRVQFILASYNVGLGHVLDAQRLSLKYDSTDSEWTHMSKYLELKAQPQYYRDEVVRHGYCRGREPVQYVQSISSLYHHYCNVPNE